MAVIALYVERRRIMATLKYQKNVAARILKCGKSRVWLNPSRINDVSEAITAFEGEIG